jgi:hypothetical protein
MRLKSSFSYVCMMVAESGIEPRDLVSGIRVAYNLVL